MIIKREFVFPDFPAAEPLALDNDDPVHEVFCRQQVEPDSSLLNRRIDAEIDAFLRERPTRAQRLKQMVTEQERQKRENAPVAMPVSDEGSQRTASQNVDIEEMRRLTEGGGGGGGGGDVYENTEEKTEEVGSEEVSEQTRARRKPGRARRERGGSGGGTRETKSNAVQDSNIFLDSKAKKTEHSKKENKTEGEGSKEESDEELHLRMGVKPAVGRRRKRRKTKSGTENQTGEEEYEEEEDQKPSNQKMENKAVGTNPEQPSTEEKSEMKTEEKSERKSEETTERKSEERSERKSEEKSERKSEVIPEEKHIRNKNSSISKDQKGQDSSEFIGGFKAPPPRVIKAP
jgi:hypothetical protein